MGMNMPATVEQFDDLLEEKPLKPISELPLKQQVYALLRKEGMTNPQIAETLSLSLGHAKNISAKVAKYDLTDSKIVHIAHRSFKKLLAGKPVGKHMKEVKDSTVLKAAEMVFDRTQPKVTRNENLNLSVSFIDIPIEELT